MKDFAHQKPKLQLTEAQQKELDELSDSDRAVYDALLVQSGNHAQAIKNIYASWC